MQQTYPHFLSPLTMKGKTWRTRAVESPIGGMELTPDGHINPDQYRYNHIYGAGRPAEVIVGEFPVSTVGGRDANEAYDLDDPIVQAGVREYAHMIQDDIGAIAMIELAHMGYKKYGHKQGRIVGPMAFTRPDGVPVEAMDEAEIARTCADFAHAAQRMQECGFDGVVIHTGHGWLLHQFLSVQTNQRTDRFGGSLENRARLTLMILQAIRARCGESLLIECRISGSENIPDGYSLEEICTFARMLEQYADIIHVSAGIYHDPVNTHMMTCIYDKHGCNAEIAAAIKKAVKIPVSVVGGINSPELAEEIIASGKADLVVFGRQMISDPLLPVKAAEGRGDEVRGCLRCMRCFPGPFEHVQKEIEDGTLTINLFETMHSCSINPEFKNGFLKDLPPAQAIKKVVVVGGGAAGMQAAITAHDRGHQVTLIEKTSRLGGILNFAEEDEDKQDLARFARTEEAELRRRNVSVLLNTTLTPELLARLDPDAVIAAVGSSPAMPPIPGLDGTNVIQAMQAYRKKARFGKQVVVLGGGTVGCETAIHIARQGSRVTLVEMLGSLCSDAYRLHREKLRYLIGKCAHVHLNTTCREITADGVYAADADGREILFPADQVINALGMKANSYADLESMSQGRAFYAIGDCVQARNLFSATDEAFRTAVRL